MILKVINAAELFENRRLGGEENSVTSVLEEKIQQLLKVLANRESTQEMFI